MDGPCLQFVRVEGDIHRVSEFAILPPEERPAVFCPECQRPVRLKLGNIRVHHAAHQPGDICASTQPETAIHINTKYHLQMLLSGSSTLAIWQHCMGWSTELFDRECPNSAKRPYEFLSGWDSVEVECPFGSYRLDVALLEGAKVVGAIEVLVTHPSEESKIEYLDQQGIPWMEIRATEEFYDPSLGWNAETPLEPERHSPLPAPVDWQCPECLSAERDCKRRIDDRKRAEEERERKAEYARQFENEYVRYVDIYYPTGKKFRATFVIQKRMRNDFALYAELQDVSSNRRSVAIEHAPITEESYERLKKALEGELDARCKPGWIIDRSCSWRMPFGPVSQRCFSDLEQYPYNFEWHGSRWQRAERRRGSPTIASKPGPGVAGRRVRIEPAGVKPQPPQPELPFPFLDEPYECEHCHQVTSEWVSRDPIRRTCVCRECSRKGLN